MHEKATSPQGAWLFFVSGAAKEALVRPGPPGLSFVHATLLATSEELGKKVSVQAVDQEFERRVANAERAVRRNIKVPISQAQFDALCSLTYNTGPTGANGTYGFINANDFEGAAANISKLIKIKEKGKKKLVIAPGLIKRREEESAPFRTKQEK